VTKDILIEIQEEEIECEELDMDITSTKDKKYSKVQKYNKAWLVQKPITLMMIRI
jgi:hypothetical protein